MYSKVYETEGFESLTLGFGKGNPWLNYFHVVKVAPSHLLEKMASDGQRLFFSLLSNY